MTWTKYPLSFSKIRLYIPQRCIFSHQRWDSKNLSGSPRHDGRAPCLPAGTPRSPTAPTGCHSCSGHNGLQQLAGFVLCKCSLLGESIYMVLQVRVTYDLYINRPKPTTFYIFVVGIFQILMDMYFWSKTEAILKILILEILNMTIEDKWLYKAYWPIYSWDEETTGADLFWLTEVGQSDKGQRARPMMANENTASFMKGFALHIISRRSGILWPFLTIHRPSTWTNT